MKKMLWATALVGALACAAQAADVKVGIYPWGEKDSQYAFMVDIKRTVLNAFMETFMPVIFEKKKDEDSARRLHRATEGTVFVAVPLMYAGLFLTLLV